MSDSDIDTIESRDTYNDEYTHLVNSVEPGDVLFVQYVSDHAGKRNGHLQVTSASDTTVHLIGRGGTTYRISIDNDEVALESSFEVNATQHQDILHMSKIPKAMVERSDWREWEVHLCVSRVNESSDDQVLFPEANCRSQAIELAQQRATHDLPEVGPVYDEGVPQQFPDN